MVVLSSFVKVLGGVASLATLSSAGMSKHHQTLQRRGADVLPTAPGPGDVFRTGQDCTIQWDEGTAGRWKGMSIDLMTGANKDMSKLTNVVSNFDGTSSTSYKWTCPDVTPNAPVYFYQFTDKNGANPTWTTRFTIASSSGNTVAAPNPTQPDSGDAIPWGEGKLASGSASGSSNASSSSTSTSSTDSDEDSDSTGASQTSETDSAQSSSASPDSSSNAQETSSNENTSNSNKQATTNSQNNTSGAAGISVAGAFYGLAAVAIAALLA